MRKRYMPIRLDLKKILIQYKGAILEKGIVPSLAIGPFNGVRLIEITDLFKKKRIGVAIYGNLL